MRLSDSNLVLVTQCQYEYLYNIRTLGVAPPPDAMRKRSPSSYCGLALAVDAQFIVRSLIGRSFIVAIG